jgi:hypothetical protein
METAFTRAAATLFANPDCAQVATYTPKATNIPQSLRVILANRVDDQDGLGLRVQVGQAAVEINAADVALPKNGDTVALADGRSFKVKQASRSSDMLIWHLDLTAA